ncbi:hypothetical protein [Sediminitomix flava]|uniref:Uncharacterized protein n=1 Tax=Sediminitomix flava TaxID=379075 RepID=A0A315Z689_SEDFL|nr:hypothetical protein [Sediminitomix flava]PWJ38490.1 hypothetical protein BC781_10780 [Sediminitomix flava]
MDRLLFRMLAMGLLMGVMVGDFVFRKGLYGDTQDDQTVLFIGFGALFMLVLSGVYFLIKDKEEKARQNTMLGIVVVAGLIVAGNYLM